MKPSIFLSRRIFPELVERLREDFEVEDNQADDTYTPQQTALHLAEKDGALVASSDRIDAGMLANADRLRAICSISVGTNHIDLDACTKRGIAEHPEGDCRHPSLGYGMQGFDRTIPWTSSHAIDNRGQPRGVPLDLNVPAVRDDFNFDLPSRFSIVDTSE